MLEIVSPDKMHGSRRCIKAFQGKLWIIEVVDSKFTSRLPSRSLRTSKIRSGLRFSQSFNTYGSSFPAILG